MSLDQMQRFRDVTVVPLQKLTRHVAWGGPIWPDFDQQVTARHCRDGRPSDRKPLVPDSTQPLDGPAVWVGALDLHFGHLIGEHMSRLPQSRAERPDDTYLFTLDIGQTEDSLPNWIWQVLDWYGVARPQIRLVTRPLQVAEIHVAPQREMLGKFTMQAAYLDLLDQNMQRNALLPQNNPTAYVTRAGLVAKGMGGHAGEGYLIQVLQQAGVLVMDPVQHSIRDQLAIYAGAKALIFAEGSAVYGRNLLGRLAQDIHVLRRRRGRDLGATHLTSRCKGLHFHNAAGKTLVARMEDGEIRYHRNVALYDLDVVFAVFANLGYDLKQYWDHDAYHQAVRVDVCGWLENCITNPEQFMANLAVFNAAGFSIEATDAPNPHARTH